MKDRNLTYTKRTRRIIIWKWCRKKDYWSFQTKVMNVYWGYCWCIRFEWVLLYWMSTCNCISFSHRQDVGEIYPMKLISERAICQQDLLVSGDLHETYYQVPPSNFHLLSSFLHLPSFFVSSFLSFVGFIYTSLSLCLPLFSFYHLWGRKLHFLFYNPSFLILNNILSLLLSLSLSLSRSLSLDLSLSLCRKLFEPKILAPWVRN